MYLNHIKTELDRILGTPGQIKADHARLIEPLINREVAVRIIESVLSDDATLAQIAARSYPHSLGFEKIILIDAGYQLRLHIWEPGVNSSVPLVESFHEHSFDFVSHVLHGKMENQCYLVSSLTDEDKETLEKFLSRLSKFSRQCKDIVNKQIEALEALHLAAWGSQQAEVEGLTADRQWLRQLLRMSDSELCRVVRFQGRYEALSLARRAGGYMHKLIEMVNIHPQGVLKLQDGDTYHHPHQYAHRLYIEANQPNSTMLVSTRVPNVLGGSLQRPKFTSDQNRKYVRDMYTPERLKAILTRHRQERISAPKSSSGHFLDVATGTAIP